MRGWGGWSSLKSEAVNQNVSVCSMFGYGELEYFRSSFQAEIKVLVKGGGGLASLSLDLEGKGQVGARIKPANIRERMHKRVVRTLLMFCKIICP